MQLLFPIGLLALAGLAVPLIIHLWNVKQGKTLKVGSIALLGETAVASSRSFKFRDLFLLLIRCLILILVAFIIAQPLIQKNSTKKIAGWILTGKASFPTVFQENRKTIDSLIRLGYELHDFNTGFNLMSLQDTINSDGLKTTALSYGTLLQQLNDSIPVNQSVYLFADYALNRMGSHLPQINYKLIWQPANNHDTLSSWITGYGGKKYQAKSTPSGTSYALINKDDPAAVKVALYETASGNDKQYLIAALNAIGNYSGRQIVFNTKEQADIGFWLSDEPVTPAFKSAIKEHGILFQYEKAKPVTENSFIPLNGQNISLNKGIKASTSLEKVWTDGFGNAILTKEKTSDLNIFHFYSRFNPQWSELVWNDAFVKAFMPMIIYDESADHFGFKYHPFDQRTFNTRQIAFPQLNQKPAASISRVQKPLNTSIWIVAFLLILAERIISLRKKSTVNA